MTPADFRAYSMDGVGTDWPLSYAELAPYYDAVDAFMGVSGLGGDPAYPAGLDYPLPPLPIGKGGIRAAEGANKLGLALVAGCECHSQCEVQEHVPVRTLGRVRVGLPGECEGVGRCGLVAARAPFRRTLITGARVRRIETRSDGLAEAVTWIDRSGREHRQRTQAVGGCCQWGRHGATAAAFGVDRSSGWTRQLVRSLVGKNLMLHPNSSVTVSMPRPRELAWPGGAVGDLHGVLRDPARARLRSRHQDDDVADARPAERDRDPPSVALRPALGTRDP